MSYITFSFPAAQGNDDRRIYSLRQDIMFLELLHKPFIFHLLMGGMLVYDEQFILIGNQPVCIENLSDQFKLRPCLLRQYSVIKQFHLYRLVPLH